MTPTRRSPLPGLGWAKREDEVHALYGGNKVRKLTRIFAEAERAGARRLVTAGAAGSHHVAATALHGAAAGFEVHGILGPQWDSADARAHLALTAATCATVTPAQRPRDLVGLLQAAATSLGAWRVPIGGSSAAGMAGSVALGAELAEDLVEDPVEEVVVAYGSGGTAVGLALGLALGGASARVVGVRVSPGIFARRGRIKRLLRAGARAWAAERGAPMGDDVLARALAQLTVTHLPGDPGYSHPWSPATEAVAEGARLGLPLEATYSGRAFAWLLQQAPGPPAAFVVTGSAVVPAAPPAPAPLASLLRSAP